MPPTLGSIFWVQKVSWRGLQRIHPITGNREFVTSQPTRSKGMAF